ncbi:MAG: hypothetical protein ACTS4U_00035 [Candidatus Hodgkinia cicadicola]
MRSGRGRGKGRKRKRRKENRGDWEGEGRGEEKGINFGGSVKLREMLTCEGRGSFTKLFGLEWILNEKARR